MLSCIYGGKLCYFTCVYVWNNIWILWVLLKTDEVKPCKSWGWKHNFNPATLAPTLVYYGIHTIPSIPCVHFIHTHTHTYLYVQYIQSTGMKVFTFLKSINFVYSTISILLCFAEFCTFVVMSVWNNLDELNEVTLDLYCSDRGVCLILIFLLPSSYSWFLAHMQQQVWPRVIKSLHLQWLTEETLCQTGVYIVMVTVVRTFCCSSLSSQVSTYCEWLFQSPNQWPWIQAG